MASRVNFNVYRYGKTIQWNFSSPSVNMTRSARMQFVFTVWIENVLRLYNIKPFKIFFDTGGEFPAVKVIGYRQLYFKIKNVEAAYPAVARSRKISSGADVFSKTAAAVPALPPKLYKRARMSGKLRRAARERKHNKARYLRAGVPVLSAPFFKDQINNFFVADGRGARCNLQHVPEYDFLIAAASLRAASRRRPAELAFTYGALWAGAIRWEAFPSPSSFIDNYLAASALVRLQLGGARAAGPAAVEDFKLAAVRLAHVRYLTKILRGLLLGPLVFSPVRATALFFSRLFALMALFEREGGASRSPALARAAAGYLAARLFRAPSAKLAPARHLVIQYLAGTPLSRLAGVRHADGFCLTAPVAADARLYLENLRALAARVIRQDDLSAPGDGDLPLRDTSHEDLLVRFGYQKSYIFVNELRAALLLSAPEASSAHSRAPVPGGAPYSKLVAKAAELEADLARFAGEAHPRVAEHAAAVGRLLTKITSVVARGSLRTSPAGAPRLLKTLGACSRALAVIFNFDSLQRRLVALRGPRSAQHEIVFAPLFGVDPRRCEHFSPHRPAVGFSYLSAAVLRAFRSDIRIKVLDASIPRSGLPAAGWYFVRCGSRFPPGEGVSAAILTFRVLPDEAPIRPSALAWRDSFSARPGVCALRARPSPVANLLDLFRRGAALADFARRLPARGPAFRLRPHSGPLAPLAAPWGADVGTFLSSVAASGRAGPFSVRRSDELLTHEERVLMLNIRNSFYVVFGIFYDVEYYPLARLFSSDPRMQDLANSAARFVRAYITSRPREAAWLNEFILLYYASIFTRSTSAIVKFMAFRFKMDKRWGQPLGFMFAIIKSVNLKEFGIAGIRIAFHGKFGGHDRAFRLVKIWGADPCLRNGLLTGSYSFEQILSKYGITHLHLWMTYF